MTRPRIRLLLAPLVALATLTAAAGCSDDDAKSSDDNTETTVAVKLDEKLAAQVVDHYAEGVYATYSTSLETAQSMATLIEAFIADPTEVNLGVARQAWISARGPYGLTEAFRFYGGPIDNDKDGPEGRINGWPLDEQYIDYTATTPGSGLIGDASALPNITPETLADANEKGGEANLATGWHAIEFLLWGQDLSATGPGARPATDYTTAPNAERRKSYLSAVTSLLIRDLTMVTDAWAPDADNYRADFVKQPVTKSLTDMITGIGELSRGELAGERMNVAYEERDQENEHSCFSDNTTADLLGNANGIKIVWMGGYDGVAEGPGLSALVDSVDSATAAKVTEDIAASVQTISQIPTPFDQNLTADAPDDGPGRTAIKQGIEQLGTQTDAIVKAGASLGVKVEVS